MVKLLIGYRFYFTSNLFYSLITTGLRPVLPVTFNDHNSYDNYSSRIRYP